MIKCEKCQKEFSKDFALQMHLMTGKKYQSYCYQYYLEKYHDEDNFPTRRYSENKLGENFVQCEYCKRRFKNLTPHLRRYSPKCYQYYLEKYHSEDNFPLGVLNKKGKCERCGGQTSHYTAKYCIDCYRHHYHLQDNPYAIKQIKESLRKFYSDPNNRKMASVAQKKSFKEKPWLAENQRKYMLDGGALKALMGNNNPSKPQIEFFNLVKECGYDTVIMNYPIYDLNILLDIAIPELKIDFEYDGSYWHQNEESDNQRDDNLKRLKWEVYRFRDQIPSKEEILKIIKRKMDE
jgi:hypothetical protein